MEKLYIIFIFFTSIICAQENRLIILGKATNKSLPIENVHIINKTTNKGSLSNSLGDFQIYVKVNDTLIFSNIQFNTKIVIINNNIIKNKHIEVSMTLKTNVLDEVLVEQHKNMAKSLGLPNAGKKPLNKLERNLNAYSQEPLAIVILATLLGQQGGIDDIYNIISGNRKRDRKLKSLIDQDKLKENNQKYILKIREHFQDDFFISTLKISKENINAFINYCIPKNIIFLFNKKRHLDLVDIFITESQTFKNN